MYKYLTLNKYLLVLLLFISCKSKVPQQLDFQELLPNKLDKKNIFSMDKYNVWGTNILKGKDGQYHAIFSRWLKSRGFSAWVTHSEIAHAVSDDLTGPYTFKNVVLSPRGDKYWDGSATHNPDVIEYKGKYYMYYMGNKGSGYWANKSDRVMPKPSSPEWWINRNNQRIGLAIANNLNGEWKRYDKPLIDTKKGQLMVSTPVVSIRPDGKFLMTYKYVKDTGGYKGGKVIHVTALSDSPKGPFVKTKVSYITADDSFAIDDHVEWYQDGRYYSIVKDVHSTFTNFSKGSMVLFTSNAKGLKWKLANKPLVFPAGQITWADGTVTQTDRTADMPKVYMEDGRIKALIIATLPRNKNKSFVNIIPLKKY